MSEQRKAINPVLLAGIDDPYLHPAHTVTLRDLFAAAALQGQLAAEDENKYVVRGLRELASFAYQIADAMLAERARSR